MGGVHHPDQAVAITVFFVQQRSRALRMKPERSLSRVCIAGEVVHQLANVGQEDVVSIGQCPAVIAIWLDCLARPFRDLGGALLVFRARLPHGRQLHVRTHVQRTRGHGAGAAGEFRMLVLARSLRRGHHRREQKDKRYSFHARLLPANKPAISPFSCAAARSPHSAAGSACGRPGRLSSQTAPSPSAGCRLADCPPPR